MGLLGPIKSWARPRHSAAGILASFALSVMLLPVLTAGVGSPEPGVAEAAVPRPAVPVATLSRHGDDVVITGSVAALFQTAEFAGPNRAQKVNRARLTPDGVTVSSGFEGIRTHLAELRLAEQKGTGKPVIAPVVKAASPDTVAVASIDPTQSAALGAIDQVVPMGAAPMPVSAPARLAYARETTPATAFDLTVDKYGDKVSQKDIWCMATAIYFEARGESYRGQVAVGQVVMNRVAHRLYPNNICQVVFQNQHIRNGCQFSFACDGIPETVNDQKSWKQADEIARGVINGSLYLTDVSNATHYHATYVYPDWAPRLKRLTKIGHHIFYRFKRA